MIGSGCDSIPIGDRSRWPGLKSVGVADNSAALADGRALSASPWRRLALVAFPGAARCYLLVGSLQRGAVIGVRTYAGTAHDARTVNGCLRTPDVSIGTRSASDGALNNLVGCPCSEGAGSWLGRAGLLDEPLLGVVTIACADGVGNGTAIRPDP